MKYNEMGSNIDTSYTDSVLADIKVACDKLMQQGLESLVLTVGNDVFFLSGSQTGRDFLSNRDNFITDFKQYCKEKSQSNWAEKRFSNSEEKWESTSELTDRPTDEPVKTVCNGIDSSLFDGDTDENETETPGFNKSELDGWMDKMIKSEVKKYKRKKSSKSKAKTRKSAKKEKVPTAVKQEPKSFSKETADDVVSDETKENQKDKIEVDEAVDDVDDDEEVKFNCKDCSSDFKTSLELADHIGLNHEKPLEEGCYPCRHCGFQFCYEAHLVEHNIQNPECIFAVSGKKPRDKTEANSLEFKVMVKDSDSGESRKESLKKLLTIDKSDLPVKCPICNKSFDKVFPYQGHILTHPNIGLKKCHICLKSMNISSSMPRHFSIHEERPHFCTTCYNRFLNQSRCDHHIQYSCKKTKHRPGLICTVCGYQTKSMSHLMQHSKKHTHVQSTCSVCNRTFKSTENFLRHKSKAHLSPHQCSICGKTFKQKDSLKKHERDHGPRNYKCEVCGKLWSDEAKLKRHMQTHSGIKIFPFICEICGQAFSRRTILESHRLLHTGETPFKCDFQGCTKAFRSSSALRQHKEYHASFKAFVCDFCGLSFKRECMMKHHRKSHTEYQWPCEYCGTKFNGRKRFKTHILTHHIDKVTEIEEKTKLKFFRCEVCDKILSQSHVFKEHMAIHRGHKPNKCAHCGKGFSTRSNMRQHERTHTGGKKLRCGLCSKTYNDPKALDTHINNRHNGKAVRERKPRTRINRETKPVTKVEPPVSTVTMFQGENEVVTASQQLIHSEMPIIDASQQYLPLSRAEVDTSQQLMSVDSPVINTSPQLMAADRPVALMTSVQTLHLMQPGNPNLMAVGQPDQSVEMTQTDQPMNYSLPQPHHQFVSSFPPIIFND